MNDRQEGPVPAELVCVQPADGGGPVLVPRASLLPGLAPHELRVVQEAQDLDAKLTKLMAFTSGSVFAGLSEEDRMLLARQQSAMADYAFVLAARIQRFKPAGADSEGGEV